MNKYHWFLLFLLISSIGCTHSYDGAPVSKHTSICECNPQTTDNTLQDSLKPIYQNVKGALLATRFATLEELRKVVQIKYSDGKINSDSAFKESSVVCLSHCSNGYGVTSVLAAGISQGEIKEVRDGGFRDKVDLVFRSPYAIRYRRDLKRVNILARRRPDLYGEGDVAFFDLAETSVLNIDPEDFAILNPQDSSEKGYLNTFNHFTAQAFITSFFSEELADYVADVHERKAMPELISGQFTEEQLSDPNNNPIDNYVDIINNEWGQEFGKRLKKKYKIDRNTRWTPLLLTNYLNDVQSYYSWSLQIGFQPFRPTDEVIIRFSDKINDVMEMDLSKTK